MKKYSVKFWVTFWLIAAALLIGWYIFLAGGKSTVSENGTRSKIEAAWDIFNYLSQKDGIERNILVLIQNDMELRPGGGFIGSFGIVKIKDGRATDIQIHDTGVFDGRIPDGVPAPYPFERLIKIKDWKMRDSNWSGDFPTNAEKAKEFYYLGQGQEKFDGVVGINTRILGPILEVTGPIEVPGYPGSYSGENAILNIEYQVEKGFAEQNIDFGDRKVFLLDFAKVVMDKLHDLSLGRKIDLAKRLEQELDKKNIMLYLSDEQIQSEIDGLGWSGRANESWDGDYLSVLDANINGWKSDYYVKRSAEYSVDLTKEKPTAHLKLTYNHTAKQKDWMTNDYQSYTRVYAPAGSWLNNISGTVLPTQFADEFGRQVFGDIIQVKIGETKSIDLDYTLPEDLKTQPYKLLIQKQSGSGTVPVKIKVTDTNGQVTETEIQLEGDYQFELE